MEHNASGAKMSFFLSNTYVYISSSFFLFAYSPKEYSTSVCYRTKRYTYNRCLMIILNGWVFLDHKCILFHRERKEEEEEKNDREV